MRIYDEGARGWTLKRLTTSTAQVPSRPGVYVLSRIRTEEGLPIAVTHIYVGKSIDLRRRLNEHTMRREAHDQLRRFMVSHHKTLWIWYSSDVAPDDVETLEVSLIRSLRPAFNTHHNPDTDT